VPLGVTVRARPIGWLVVAAVISVAVLGFLLVSSGPLGGGCSDAESRFAYTVYGTDMIGSTEVSVFSAKEKSYR
jgi:hypothetical protein